MALSMTEKPAERSEQSTWSPELVAEFEREAKNPNPCVGSSLLSENERVRVWEIRLRPGERIGFHRHVLDYFWTAVTAGRGRSRMHDGSTVEKSYFARETQHESYGPGESKIQELYTMVRKKYVRRLEIAMHQLLPV